MDVRMVTSGCFSAIALTPSGAAMRLTKTILLSSTPASLSTSIALIAELAVASIGSSSRTVRVAMSSATERERGGGVCVSKLGASSRRSSSPPSSPSRTQLRVVETSLGSLLVALNEDLANAD
jgi:hypothetical protein